MDRHHRHDQGRDPECRVNNEPHFHAFALLGKERLFASHLTMLDVEIHMYQLVMEVSLPEPYHSLFVKERETNPRDSYFIANTVEDREVGNPYSDPMTVPELSGGLRKSFIGNIFRGIPYKPAYSSWPWAGVRPVIANIPVNMERIVHFRPFAQSLSYPETLTYLLFGAGREAHMVNFQTKKPDFDHVLSLGAAPDWLAQDLLRAGALVDLPDAPRLRPEDMPYGVRCANPFIDGAAINVRYRGAGPVRPLHIDRTTWFCLRVCNHPDPCTHCRQRCGTETPREYLAT